MTLTCNTKYRRAGNPHEMKESEKKGVTFMTLEEYDSVAENERDPTFGILRTEISTVPNDLGFKLMKKSVLTNGKETEIGKKRIHSWLQLEVFFINSRFERTFILLNMVWQSFMIIKAKITSLWFVSKRVSASVA